MAKYPCPYGLAYFDHHSYPKGFLLLSLDRRVLDKIYIDKHIMLQVLEIRKEFAVIEFNFWKRPLPTKLNLLPKPDTQRVKACRVGCFMRVAPGVQMMVIRVLNPLSRISIGLEAPRGVSIDRGEVRFEQQRKVA